VSTKPALWGEKKPVAKHYARTVGEESRTEGWSLILEGKGSLRGEQRRKRGGPPGFITQGVQETKRTWKMRKRTREENEKQSKKGFQYRAEYSLMGGFGEGEQSPAKFGVSIGTKRLIKREGKRQTALIFTTVSVGQTRVGSGVLPAVREEGKDDSEKKNYLQRLYDARRRFI